MISGDDTPSARASVSGSYNVELEYVTEITATESGDGRHRFPRPRRQSWNERAHACRQPLRAPTQRFIATAVRCERLVDDGSR